ncbi:unnamed protein product [Arabidopsis halleri]
MTTASGGKAKYIIGALIGSFGISYLFDKVISDNKIFGGKNDLNGYLLVKPSGTTPGTVSNKEWWAATDEKFQAWPRTAGPPVVMNPISRQNFIVKTRPE